MADARPVELVRALRRRDLTGVLLNAMLGAGMLAAPAKVFAVAGGWSFAVLAASALLLLPLVLCFAELGSRYDATGGPYVYAREGLGPLPAFAVGWLSWLSQALSIATLANLFVSYLAGFAPVLADGAPRVILVVALGAVLTGVVLAGIRQSAGVSNALAAVKLGFVALFLLAGLPFVDLGRVELGAPPALPDFAQAMLVYLFAYTGFERGAIVAGEAREPRRDVPPALFAGVTLATLAYAAVLLVCVGTLDAPAATDRPLAEAGDQLYGSAGRIAVTAGALAVILGTLLVIVLSMPRMLLALAADRMLPAALARVHPVRRTPHVAIIVSGALGFGLALFADLLTALTFATATRLLGYILSCVALWRLSARADAPRPRFPLPLAGSVALVTAALFSAVLMIGASTELPMLAAMTAAGFVVLLAGRRKAARS